MKDNTTFLNINKAPILKKPTNLVDIRPVGFYHFIPTQ